MHSRTIKVGDLLTKPGTDDLMIRPNQPMPSLTNLTDQGVDLTMKIASVNHDEVWITIIGLKAQFNEVCDYSGVDYIRTLEFTTEDNEIIRFAARPDSDDEVYPIHTRDSTIDLLQPLTQLMQLYEPVSKIAPGYIIDTRPDDYSEAGVVGNKIIFT